jgi:TfoX/Sxy family transcriptional regulator of competence genes
MAYNEKLANRIRECLSDIPNVEEKKMFGGLAFMVNDKMCINVSGENLMCRFDPNLEDKLSKRKGYKKVIMKGRNFNGYCYVEPEGFKSKKDFDFWLKLCLDFNKEAKSSKR